jgi:hypothetical protein
MMKKSIKVMPKKRRGRPATGKDPQVVIRMPTALIDSVDAWGKSNGAVRSEAIRRLVELGLTVKTRGLSTSKNQKLRAREIAGKAIDKMTDTTASSEDQATRKKRLLRGPEEFQTVRVDQAKRKTYSETRNHSPAGRTRARSKQNDC